MTDIGQLSGIGEFVFISYHGRLLQSWTNGEMHASQDVKNVGEEERWNVYVWPEGQISLQNYRTNRWLTAEDNGRATCNAERPQSWEQWTLHAVGDKTNFALKGYHGRWLCAQEPGHNVEGGGEVTADRPECREWERFSMIPSKDIPLRNQSWWNDALRVVQVAAEVVPILVKAAG